VNVALDTNVLVDLWANTAQGRTNAATLHALQAGGHGLSISGVVYAELHGIPGISKVALDTALAGMGVTIDALTPLAVWDEAGRVHAAISQRRRKAKVVQARRPLADHLIGAHALVRADALLTSNPGDFTDFAALRIIR